MNAYVKRSNKCFGNYLFFNGYGAFLKVQDLEYKALFLELVEMKKGVQFLETRQGVLFQVLKVQNWFASMILSVSH